MCLFERNIALQPKIQGNLGDLYEQNDVSVSKVRFRFKVFIPRIPSVFRYRGKSLALFGPNSLLLTGRVVRVCLDISLSAGEPSVWSRGTLRRLSRLRKTFVPSLFDLSISCFALRTTRSASPLACGYSGLLVT